MQNGSLGEHVGRHVTSCVVNMRAHSGRDTDGQGQDEGFH